MLALTDMRGILLGLEIIFADARRENQFVWRIEAVISVSFGALSDVPGCVGFSFYDFNCVIIRRCVISYALGTVQS